MKVMLRRSAGGSLSVYVPKKDLEEPVVATELPGLWGGSVTLANGWRLRLPAMEGEPTLPITVDARRVDEGEP